MPPAPSRRVISRTRDRSYNQLVKIPSRKLDALVETSAKNGKLEKKTIDAALDRILAAMKTVNDELDRLLAKARS
jgi:hypothetical protein